MAGSCKQMGRGTQREQNWCRKSENEVRLLSQMRKYWIHRERCCKGMLKEHEFYEIKNNCQNSMKGLQKMEFKKDKMEH